MTLAEQLRDLADLKYGGHTYTEIMHRAANKLDRQASAFGALYEAVWEISLTGDNGVRERATAAIEKANAALRGQANEA